MQEDQLLIIDGVVNLALGTVLLFFPRGLADLLAVPVPSSSFYPSILGGVLIGIGLALLLHRFRGRSRVIGLGIEGAIAINLCGAGVLMAWLIAGHLTIPIRGYVLLWIVTILVLGIGLIEIAARIRRVR